MTEQNYEWARAEERALARYVDPDDLPAEFKLPPEVNRLDVLAEKNGKGIAALLYQQVCAQNIQYDLAPFNPRLGVVQSIRKPATLLAEKRGTCLDLAVLFATMCLDSDLLPLVVIVDGHAFAGLSLLRTRQDDKKPPQAFAWDKGKLTDLSVLQELAGQEYLFIECTGAARSKKALASKDGFPETRQRDETGLMSFERACEAGSEQLLQHARLADGPASPNQRTFLYALDIHDLQIKHGFEPIKDEQDNVVIESQTQVDARGSQGFINQPTGPVTQNNINTQGGDYADGNIDKRSGTFNTVSAGGDLNIGGDFVGRDNITINAGVSGAELAQLFVRIQQQIRARPPDPNVDKEEITGMVERIQQEATKGETANGSKLDRWLRDLADVAPDIFDVTVAALTSPVAAVGMVVKKVAEKAKAAQ
jgi:hypothetical protein